MEHAHSSQLKRPYFNHHLRRFNDILEKILSYPQIKSVYDAGCSDAYLLVELNKRRQGLSLYGGEYDDHCLGVGQRNTEAFSNIKVTKADVRELPKDPHYDVVVCSEVMEHVGGRIEESIDALLEVSDKACLISIPVETGIVGIAKYLGRVAFRRTNELPEGYLKMLLTGTTQQCRIENPEDIYPYHIGFDDQAFVELVRQRTQASQRPHEFKHYYTSYGLGRMVEVLWKD